jgi:hypothetical protein
MNQKIATRVRVHSVTYHVRQNGTHRWYCVCESLQFIGDLMLPAAPDPASAFIFAQVLPVAKAVVGCARTSWLNVILAKALLANCVR